MCGIAGLFSYRDGAGVDEGALAAMRDTMAHRGPDGKGMWISPDRSVGLAHRRLSIVDLSAAAAQPMTNETGQVWITFNGEIYNHLPLRRALSARGHLFRTDHSDTEVLIHGFEEWGIAGLLERIEGDYGFALWDGRSGSLYLARDRIGVKPLYFSFQGGLFLFGSEIKAIASHPRVRRDIDPDAMYHYLSFMASPAPLTMFKGIYKLPAGSFLRVGRDGQVEATEYWSAVPGRSGAAPAGADADTLSQYIAGVQSSLAAAVDKRMMSDVPFGVFLSGGIDSSTNVALMQRHSPRPLETFSVGFRNFEHLNELEHARAVSKRFGTNHHEVLIDDADMAGYLDRLVHHQDEPLADWVCIPLYFVSRLAKDSGVTVVQVGEGSDEQFAGYPGYLDYLRLHQRYWTPFRRWLPRPVQRAAALAACAAARLRPRFETKADIVGRAAAGGEMFWTGSTVFWESVKRRLVNLDALPGAEHPPEIYASGLLPPAFLQRDSARVIESYLQPFDAAHPGSDALTRMIHLEFKLRLPELLLMRVDKIAMSTSVEARVPFLDHKLVELTMDIPQRWKVPGGAPKDLLKKAVRGLIPDAVIDRPKMGFSAPMPEWLRTGFGRKVESQVMGSRLLQRDFFSRDYIARLFKGHLSGRENHATKIWVLFNLVAWYDHWVDA